MEWIKRVWNWLRSKMARFFRHSPSEVVISQNQEVQEATKVVATRWQHNMPKSQPCPRGHGWKKRVEKTMGGAIYWCNRCQSNFIVKRA